MAVAWSKSQREVFDEQSRGQNLLVRASAGSGKTAVLVERIVKLVKDEKNAVDIDRFLVVTFTRAAANELKERIRERLGEALAAEPENAHLARQTLLIHNAQITTIDGFCTRLLREHAHLTGLTPDFRVAEEGELKLLQEDVLDALLLQLYEGESEIPLEDFHLLVESFVTGKSERALREAILSVFDAAESHPRPAAYLAACRENNRAESFETVGETTWMHTLLKEAEAQIAEAIRLCEEGKEAAAQQGGPASYIPTLESDLEFLCSLRDVDSADAFEQRCALLRAHEFPRLANAPKGVDEALKDKAKGNRDKAKEIVAALQKDTFAFPGKDALAILQKSGAVLDVLIAVVEAFRDLYAAAKRKKKLVDFADIEHFALELLREEDGTRTPLAKEMAKHFVTVMVDEYQDSNHLQEEILTAVAATEDGRDNYFSVGDIKQSIYGFRNAEPELFLEKGKQYDAGDGRCIDLQENFRSRREVTDSVNAIFRQIMRAEIGGVDYDDKAALIAAADYPAGKEERYTTEVLLVQTEEEESAQNDFVSDKEDESNLQLEARAIAEKIATMLEKETIYDTKEKCERPMRGSDITILLATMKGRAEVFEDALHARGIEAFTTQRGAYFDAQEVLTVLNFLNILIDPLSEVPLAAVLVSPFSGLSMEELGILRAAAGAPYAMKKEEQWNLYDLLRLYAGEIEDAEASEKNPLPIDESLREKCKRFLSFYQSVRESVPYTPLHELLTNLLSESGYLDTVRALPGGLQRAANLRMLIDKAISYEAGSYVGLFNFIRYIRKLEKVEHDFGAAPISGENENAVRICSIHKSKGLQYPVVFVADLAKGFNLQDTTARLQIDRKLGLATDYIDTEARTRQVSLKRKALARRKKMELIGEQLRVYYVACTRAQQKLILSCVVPKEEKLQELLQLPIPLHEEVLPAEYILQARSPSIWFLPAIERERQRAANAGGMRLFIVETVSPAALTVAAVHQEADRAKRLATLRNLSQDVVYDKEMRDVLAERFAYIYPYAGHEDLPVKLSVTALKAGEEKEEEATEVYPAEEIIPTIPLFAQEDPKQADVASGGAVRGTAQHEFMRFANLQAWPPNVTEEDIKTEIDRLVAEGKLSVEQAALISVRAMANFCNDPLGQRMRKADLRGELYREQPFVMQVPADAIDPTYPPEEKVLVQGIIDAFFMEEGEIVLIDYKSDRVRALDDLTARYHRQLEVYAQALTKILRAPVKEKQIWSFHLGAGTTVCRTERNR